MDGLAELGAPLLTIEHMSLERTEWVRIESRKVDLSFGRASKLDRGVARAIGCAILLFLWFIDVGG